MTGTVKLHRVSRPQQSVSLKLSWFQMHWRNGWHLMVLPRKYIILIPRLVELTRCHLPIFLLIVPMYYLEEIEPEYWQEHFATATPTVLQVLDAFILISQWGDDSEKLDFTLADDVTDYVICVSFDSKGQVIDISMES